MNCRYCESEICEQDKFCHECGRRVVRGSPANRREAVKAQAKSIAEEGRIAASEAAALAKTGLKTDTGKSVAACAAVGFAAGSVVPFVGSMTGAGVGAFIGLLRKL